MAYHNPQVPHEVNVSKSSDMAMFVRLSVQLALGVVACFLIVYFAFRWFAVYIPFSFEQSIAQSVFSQQTQTDEKHKSAQDQLQALADNLARQMVLPADMPVRVHLIDSDEKNAFATLGGHIILTQGLIDSVSSENALAMVLGHEIAHVRNRDPIVSAGTSLTFNLILSVVTGGDVGMIEQTSGMLTQLSFSRDQESLADQLALSALQKHYGHTHGAEAFFQAILNEESGHKPPAEFLSSHPDTKKRLTVIKQSQTQADKTLTPLPQSLLAIQNKAEKTKSCTESQ